VTPLGLACRSGASANIIRTIIREAMRARSGSKTGRRIETVAIRVLFLGSGMLDEERACPLPVLRACIEDFPSDILTMTVKRNGLDGTLLEAIVMKGRLVPDYWERINIVLKAMMKGSTPRDEELNGRRFLILHAFLEMVSGVGPFDDCENHDVPVMYEPLGIHKIDEVIDILKLIKEHAPEQFHMRDDKGRLPLHIALSNSHVVNQQEWRNYPSKLVKFLLQDYPESAGIPDRNGRLPLHIAMEHGIPCFRLVAKAEARALTTRCQVTHLYPFQLAVAGLSLRETSPRETSVNISVENAFKLLRMCPEVIGLVANAAEE